MNELKCRVPGCKWKPKGLMTGLQELQAFRKHMARAHLLRLAMNQALELRAKYENDTDVE